MTNSGCGHYGAYIGEMGGYWDMSVLNCSGTDYWQSTAADRANANGVGIGANGYWFAAGPGLDPNYDGTTAEASAWGVKQAQKAWALWQTHSNLTGSFGGDLVFIDVEEVGGAGDGWNEKVNSSCSSSNASGCCTASLDQHTIDGFINWIWNNTTIFHGIYSSNGEWNGIFGGSSAGNFSGLSQAWDADWNQNCVQPGPLNWSQGSGSCPSNSPGFFGGFSSSGNCALAWQWSGTGVGQTGPAGDYDQVDQLRLNQCE